MFFRRSQQLSLLGNRHEFAERLDRDIVAASVAAVAKMKRYGESAWSVELQNARQQVTILSKCLSMIRTRLDHRVHIQLHLAKFPNVAFQVPETIQECNTRLREANRVVKVVVHSSFARRDAERNKRIADLEYSASKAGKKSAKVLR